MKNQVVLIAFLLRQVMTQKRRRDIVAQPNQWVNESNTPLTGAGRRLYFHLRLHFLVGARQMMHALGHSGNQIRMRLVGLIVMATAVEFLFSGLRPIVQRLLRLALDDQP